MRELQGISRITLHEGKLGEFERLCARFMETVRTRDTGTLEFAIYFNDDRSECIVLERYEDFEALMQHGANVGELAQELLTAGTVTSACLGESSPALKAQLEGSPVQLFTPYLSLEMPVETTTSKDAPMPDANDWNQQTITEFRANGGRVGGPFEGAPVVLVHHHGRKSGMEYVTPMMYIPDERDDTIYVFASKGGAPSNPDWYYNLTAAGEGSIERGTDTYRVAVRDVTGDERDRIYDEQARRYPGFAEYERQTAGIRTIPVLELRRV